MKFLLKALRDGHPVVAMEIEAVDETAARDLVSRKGYAVLTLKAHAPLPLVVRRASFPTTLFTIELMALLDAGLNIIESLQALAEKQAYGSHRRVLRDLLEALYRGESLSQAVARFPACFSALYAATIRSSERTGNVKEALARYVAYQEELDRVRNKAAAALLYPAIVLIVGAMVMGFLVFYVIPRFARVYEDASVPLPLFSGLLLRFGTWLEQNGSLVALALLAASGMCGYLLSRQSVRASLGEWLSGLPLLGERVRIYQLGRFYRTVGMLLRAGIPALGAFAMVKGLLAANLETRLANAIVLLKEGRSISVALTSVGLATPVATRMMMVGERSGQMSALMDRIARFYDDETARFVGAFTRVLEPALMTILGVAVGLVVVLMYMPIFELAGAIQ